MTTSAGQRRHLVQLYRRGRTADGSGGYTETDTPLVPGEVYASVMSFTGLGIARESRVANSNQAEATHLVTFPYHAGVTAESVITFGARVFHVMGVTDADGRQIETVAICKEVVL